MWFFLHRLIWKVWEYVSLENVDAGRAHNIFQDGFFKESSAVSCLVC